MPRFMLIEVQDPTDLRELEAAFDVWTDDLRADGLILARPKLKILPEFLIDPEMASNNIKRLADYLIETFPESVKTWLRIISGEDVSEPVEDAVDVATKLLSDLKAKGVGYDTMKSIVKFRLGRLWKHSVGGVGVVRKELKAMAADLGMEDVIGEMKKREDDSDE